jgi:peptide deformylase
MRIINIHDTPSAPVTSWGEIKDAARELLELVDADTFPGNNPEAIAIHHAQVSEAPFAFFAVNSKYIEPFDLTRRLIINPRIVAVDESSVVYVKEACMSFPYRSGKHLLRYGRITVEYHIPIIGELEKLVEECAGLKAIVFQHEIDHQQGKNIYFHRFK